MLCSIEILPVKPYSHAASNEILNCRYNIALPICPVKESAEIRQE